MNGEYRGLYVLCEQTQTGKNRVNVEEDETGKLETGYLIEMVGDSDDNKYFYMKEVPASELGNGVTANWSATRKAYLKTPELEFCTDEQVAFISDYANRANRAILTQDWDAFNELCDVESFAKYFITNTILNNGDAGYQLFFYKKEFCGEHALRKHV